MSKSLRQSQSFLHTWSGMLLGWILFLVFTTGTIAFWREGLNRWMRPELARVEQPMQVLAATQAFLHRKAPDASSWFITMPSVQTPGAQTFWIPQPRPGEAPGRRRGRGRGDTQALIGADGQPSTARETRGGEFFYRFHFDLHYMPVIWARWLVGFATMMMLVAILSGIVTHKKIFRDFFTLRRQKGQRSWLDGHNATAVLALPFHLMITYTGLVTLMALLMPWAVVANYTDRDKVAESLFPTAAKVERSGRPAPLVPLVQVVRDAERRLGAPVGYIEVSDPGDAAARINVSQSPAATLSARTPRLTYEGATGRMIWRSPQPGGASATAGAMIGLHAGRYADALLRWVYFLCGVAGTLMVASGLVLWVVKRREKLPDPARPHPGFRIVDGLNVAVIGGFPFGIAAFLWANRLLPVAMRGRAEWEIHWLFIAWAAAFAFTLVARRTTAWAMLTGATGVMLVALPFWNLIATARGLPASLIAGDHMLAGIDATLFVFGLGFLAVARRVSHHRPALRAPRRRAVAAVPAPVLEPAE